MVPSKRIAPESAPETLPEDFSDWDGGGSSSAGGPAATLPAATIPAASLPPAMIPDSAFDAMKREYQVLDEAPVRERTPAPPPPPPPSPAPVSAAPVSQPPNNHAPASGDHGKRGSEKSKAAQARANASPDSDLEAFLRRLSEVNAEMAPTRPPETNHGANLWAPTTSSKAPSTPAKTSSTARQEPQAQPVKAAPAKAAPVMAAAVAPVPEKAAPVERELFSSIGSSSASSSYEDDDEDEEGKSKTRWGLIGAVAAGVVAVALAISIPMYLRGKSVSQPRPPAPPPVSQSTEEASGALKPSPSGVSTGVAAGNTAAQKPNAQNLQTANPAQTTPQPQPQAPVSSALMNQQLTASSQLPQGVHQPPPVEAPPPSGFGVAGLDGSTDPSAVSSAFKSSETKLKLAPLNVSAGVAGGLLIRRVAPQYPFTARTARVSGTVVLAATISKSGFVTNVQVISGPPMLRQSAVDAVKYWQYRPYLLNNQPTEVQTTISVDFNL